MRSRKYFEILADSIGWAIGFGDGQRQLNSYGLIKGCLLRSLLVWAMLLWLGRKGKFGLFLWFWEDFSVSVCVRVNLGLRDGIKLFGLVGDVIPIS